MPRSIERIDADLLVLVVDRASSRIRLHDGTGLTALGRRSLVNRITANSDRIEALLEERSQARYLAELAGF